jgi:uncharacterized protein YfbU (UPF0304 family)
MYRALKIAARDLPPGFLADADTEFPGFDGNNETEHFAYARFLRDAQGSGDESKEEPRNSHRPMLMRYRWMLRIWRQCADPWRLTPEDVALILSRKV